MLGAVVVLYNPSIDEIENINSYKDLVDYLVIMDNSSVNNLALLEMKLVMDNSVKYISHTDNIGLCKALNEGLLELKKRDCFWSVVFDADSKMQKDIFLKYRNIINTYNKINEVAVFAPQHNHARKKVYSYNGFKEIKWAMTSGWLINVSVFFEIGGFFEELFVDGLDLDYCYRAEEFGYKVIECGNIIIEHYPAETRNVSILGKRIKYGYSSPLRYTYQSRCLIWLIWRYKNMSDVLVYFYKWIKVLFLFDNKNIFCKSMIKGTKEGIFMCKRYKEKRSD